MATSSYGSYLYNSLIIKENEIFPIPAPVKKKKTKPKPSPSPKTPQHSQRKNPVGLVSLMRLSLYQTLWTYCDMTYDKLRLTGFELSSEVTEVDRVLESRVTKEFSLY